MPETTRSLDAPPGSAFLLAMLGAYAAARFSDRVAELDLTPPLVGLLRLIDAEPGQSQQAVAQLLGMPPSRLVGLVDTLADRGLVERRRNPDDRRLHALHTTDAGTETMRQVMRVGLEHDDAMCRGLDRAEREQLRTLLLRIVDAQSLHPGIHPGFRRE